MEAILHRQRRHWASASPTPAWRTGHAFLDDIAHLAVPERFSIPTAIRRPRARAWFKADLDDIAGNPIADRLPLGRKVAYDDELLDSALRRGRRPGQREHRPDHRAPRVPLPSTTASAQHTKDVVLATAAQGDVSFLNEWLLQPGDVAVLVNLSTPWCGTASASSRPPSSPPRCSTKAPGVRGVRAHHPAQRGHILRRHAGVRRRPQPGDRGRVRASGVPLRALDAAPTTVDRFDPDFNVVNAAADPEGQQLALIRAFLNPLEFAASGPLPPEEAAGAIVRGLTRTVGNEIDEPTSPRRCATTCWDCCSTSRPSTWRAAATPESRPSTPHVVISTM